MGDVTGLTILVPKLVAEYFHKEVYVNYADYFVIASDQKFLIEKVMDEDVTDLTIHVRDFICALLEKIYVDCVDFLSIAAPFLVMVVYQKEVSMPA